jgi:hypothetical protein
MNTIYLSDRDVIKTKFTYLADFNQNQNQVESNNLGPATTTDHSSKVTSETPVSFTRIPYAASSSEYEDFVKNPLQLFSTVWAPSTIFSNISDIFQTYVTTALSSPLGNKLANLSFVDTKFKITIVMQGMPTAFGQLVIAFDPVPNMYSYNAPPTHSQFVSPGITRCKIVPHIVLDPSKDATYEIELPAPTINGLYSLQPSIVNSGSYTYAPVLINPIGSGTSTASAVRFVVYGSLVNPKFVGKILLTSNPLIEEKRSNGLISTTLMRLGALTSNISIPTIQPYVTIFSSVTSTVGAALNRFGYSKPNISDTVLPILNRTVTNYSSTDGRNAMIKLSTHTNNSVSISPAMFGIGDLSHMDLASIMKIPVIIRQFTITTSVAYDTWITSIPIDPSAVINLSGSYEHSTISFISELFTYWTGDIDVDFEFVASIFHRATVLLAYNPVNSNTLSADSVILAAQTLDSKIVNISGNTSIRFSIPWKQQQPWAQTQPARNFTSIGTNGNIGVYILNPVTTNGSSDPIGVNVYFSSRNLKFALPTAERIELNSILLTSSDLVPLTNDVVLDDFSDFPFRYFGEDVCKTTKELAMKMSVSYVLLEGTETFTSRVLSSNIRIGPANEYDASEYSGSFFDYLSCAYVGVRGSINYMIDRNPSMIQTGASSYPNVFVGNQSTNPISYNSSLVELPSLGSPWFVVGAASNFTAGFSLVHPFVEFTVPHNYPGYFRPTYPTQPKTDVFIESFSPVYATNASTQSQLAVYNGLGDDGSFVFFRGMPFMT